MKSRLSLAVLLLISAFVFNACDEDEENPCEACQDAIDHMFHKIEDNQCNPDFMENAVNRMVQDCGQFSAQEYAGVMAHSCQFEDFTRRPECFALDDEILRNRTRLRDVQVELFVLSTRDPGDSVEVAVREIGGGDIADEYFKLSAGDQADQFFDSMLNGEEFDVIVLDPENDEVLVQKSVLNRFWREGYWDQLRHVQVQYIPLLDEYDIVFDNW